MRHPSAPRRRWTRVGSPGFPARCAVGRDPRSGSTQGRHPPRGLPWRVSRRGRAGHRIEDPQARPRGVRSRSDAGEAAGFPDQAYEEAGARIVTDTAKLWAESDLILKVRAPAPNTLLEKHEADLVKEGGRLVSFLWPGQNKDLVGAPGQAQGDGPGDGCRSPHHARAEARRAVGHGEHRRVQGGRRGGQHVRPVPRRPDHGGRPRAAGDGAGDRRRGRRTRGGRDGPRPRRDRQGVRHPRGRARAGREPRRRSSSRSRWKRRARARAATPSR